MKENINASKNPQDKNAQFTGKAQQDYTRDNWSQVQKQARQRWADLKESDLDRAEGTHDYLVSKIQQRCNLSREQAEAQVSEFEHTFQSKAGKSTAAKSTDTMSSGGAKTNR